MAFTAGAAAILRAPAQAPSDFPDDGGQDGYDPPAADRIGGRSILPAQPILPILT
jgi:hypothetical protein